MIPALNDLEEAFEKIKTNKEFLNELNALLSNYVGRPTPLFYAKNLSNDLGHDIYLKREDLNHTGAHKINNTLGQILLAKYMGKKRIIAETGAGQHGVASATAAALLGLECIVYMGEEDTQRQKPNVERMKLLGAQVVAVKTGSKTLKDAVTEAFKDWISNLDTTFYLLGSCVGPAPYPEIVKFFQSVIGKEAREQIIEKNKVLPNYVIACVGGGSNAIGIFNEFVSDKNVALIGVEAGGHGPELHCATLQKGSIGIFQGSLSYLLQDKNGQINSTHSISAGLDYPGVGPEHSFLKDNNRVEYTSVTDEEALNAFHKLCKTEGIIPALESSHALAYTFKLAKSLKDRKTIIVNLSGRGDKDLGIVLGVKY